MSWMDDHYRMDEDGNFETLADYNRAVGNGDLEELSNVVITTGKLIQNMIPEVIKSEITD